MYRNSWPLLALATYRKILKRAGKEPVEFVNGANGTNGVNGAKHEVAETYAAPGVT